MDIRMIDKNIKAGAEIHAGDGGYSIGTQEKYEEFVKIRNQSLRESKIRALIAEVGGDSYDEDGEELVPVLVGHQIQEFVELIIKETLQVARAGIEYGDGMEDAVYKYFGVEE